MIIILPNHCVCQKPVNHCESMQVKLSEQTAKQNRDNDYQFKDSDFISDVDADNEPKGGQSVYNLT